MRTFVIYSRKGRTDSRFNIEDLPSSGGRMDLVARCVNSALWLSNKIREDSEIFIVLNGPPNPPVTLWFKGDTLRKVSPDERSIGIWIKKVLSSDFGKEWKEFRNGILIARKSFQEIIKEHEKRNIYVLHEKGKKLKIKKDPVFVLGDHIGLPKNEEKFVLRYGEKLSLGKKPYLASSCISILNWMCD